MMVTKIIEQKGQKSVSEKENLNSKIKKLFRTNSSQSEKIEITVDRKTKIKKIFKKIIKNS